MISENNAWCVNLIDTIQGNSAEYELYIFVKSSYHISLQFTEAIYHSCKDERDCAWCKANDGVKFIISEDLNNKINQNCTCEWNRGIFSPEVNTRK